MSVNGRKRILREEMLIKQWDAEKFFSYGIKSLSVLIEIIGKEQSASAFPPWISRRFEQTRGIFGI